MIAAALQRIWYRDTPPPWWLQLLEAPFRSAVALRRRRYVEGARAVVRFETPVIVVGNLSVGGTGKTPVVEKFARERKSSARELIVRTVSTPSELKGANLLFVPAAEEDNLREWLASAHGQGILTVGESELFFKHGGVINFVLEGDRIRFDINIDQAEKVGLKISAQLQKLARILRRKS